MIIKTLRDTNFETIFRAFNSAFADYEMQLNETQFKSMLTRRGFNAQLSFAAFEGEEIVSFTLNGTGTYNEIPTAYDTGTGTLKEYRGKGLATEIFNHSIPYLKEKGIKQYLLEVLQHNTKAHSVYEKLGFETTRQFNYFIQNREKINNEIKLSPFSVNHFDSNKYNYYHKFWDFPPSWQNSFQSLDRASEKFSCLGAFNESKLLGYICFEVNSGDIAQLAVDKQFRRKGIASLLLQNTIKQIKNETVRIINTDISCSSITDFLASKNIIITGKQFEMLKKL